MFLRTFRGKGENIFSFLSVEMNVYPDDSQGGEDG